MTDSELLNLFIPLYADLRPEDLFDVRKPLLAHYTTIKSLEKILQTNEIWFSNPRFMNDMEEVRFGVLQGNTLVIGNEDLANACRSPEREHLFQHAFAYFFDEFANKRVLNTYVFCLSEHDKDDNDGLLSMWRGYCANGNGVSIVFDTAQLNTVEGSPLIIADVHYETTEARVAWLHNIIAHCANIIRTSVVPDEKLYLAAHALFERIKLFALFTKHCGFKEEHEWRVLYLPERDARQMLAPMFHYTVGSRGVEPKLRFKVKPIQGLTADDLSLTKIVDRIILGPSVSSPLAASAMERMFELLGHDSLKAKLRTSTIPFRAIV